VNFALSLLKLCTIRQEQKETNLVYWIRFKLVYDAVQSAGGRHVFRSVQLASRTAADANNVTDAELDAQEESLKAKWLIMRSDDSRYADLRKKLREDTNLGNNQYPTTCTEALQVLAHHSNILGHRDTNSRFGGNHRNNNGGGRLGHQFVQQGGRGGRGNDNGSTVLDRRGRPIQCHACGGNHYAFTSAERTTRNPVCPMANPQGDNN
jgi:hypothetical protein